MPKSQTSEKPVPGRLLGDKWLDWDGGDERKTLASADTPGGVALTLAGVGAVILVAALFLLWYLVTPRLEQFHAAAPWVFGALVILLSVFIFAIGGSMILTLATGKNFLILRNQHRILLGAVSILHRLGNRFGIHSDRVSNSLLKVNNALILTTVPFTGKDKVLLLLPRCLTKEIRKQILDAAGTLRLSHATCTGGEDARKKILLERPSVVVAVACERDLIAGIRDVKAGLPVIGIPNRRPKGPCKCTEISFSSLVRTLSILLKKDLTHLSAERTEPIAG